MTRPNLGTAMSMSKTLAVETYSGGSSRIVSIWTLPSFRSFFELGAPDPDVVRPLERFHPLIERARGCLCGRLRRDHRADESSTLGRRIKQYRFAQFAEIFPI